jgi:hypothetical protein
MNESTKMVPWKEAMQGKVKEQAAAEKVTGTFISLKSGVMSYGGLPVQGNKADMIVLESIHENTYYPDKYGTTENQSPTCYAFSLTGIGMVPHPEAAKPQAKTCAECPRLKWGTADNGAGKGKACSERRRLGVVPASSVESVEAIDAASVAYIRVPVTSVKHWSAYVQNVLAKTDMPVFGSITNVALVPDAKTQIKLTFTHVATIKDDELLEALYKRAAIETTMIDFPYPKPQDGESEAVPAKKQKSKF